MPRKSTPAASVSASPAPEPGEALSSYSATAGRAICHDIENGVPLPEAFLCHGVPAEVGEAWLAAQPGFAHEVEFARARYLRSLIQEVREAVAGPGARHDWRASMALLERNDAARASAPRKTGKRSINNLSSAQLIDLQTRRRAAMAPSATPAGV